MINIQLTLEEAKVIHKNLTHHFVTPDHEEQRTFYDFVHKLDYLIDIEQQVSNLTNDSVSITKDKLDK